MSLIIPKKLLGDCREELLTVPEQTFHLAVTSPPYHGMRNYLPKDHPWKAKEIGSEPTIELYLDHLVEAFRAVRRVLRDDGVLWVNMGDRYTSGGRKTYDPERLSMSGFVNPAAGVERPADPSGLGRKELCMMPIRLAMALQADGWLLRSMCPWIKRNTLPESVEDRPATALEYFFMFSKTERYFYDRDAVGIVASKNTDPRAAVFPHRDLRDADRGRRRKPTPKAGLNVQGSRQNADFESHLDFIVTKRNRRNSDWFMESWQGLLLDDDGDPLAFVINPKGTSLEHFASYPPKLIEPIIRSCTSEQGCCSQCGASRVRVVEKGEPDRAHQQACGGDELGLYHGQATKPFKANGVQDASAVKSRILAGMVERKTIGWKIPCQCEGAYVVPCRVLDPFAGTGCTGMVATRLGRDYLGCELNPDTFKMSDARDGQTAMALL